MMAPMLSVAQDKVEQDFDKPAQEFNIAVDRSTCKLGASQLIKEYQS
jgi:hypothetical protein